MSLKQTLLALSLGGSALTSCSTMQNQSLNDIPPIQPTPIVQTTQAIQSQEETKAEETIKLPRIKVFSTVNTENFNTNFLSLTKSLLEIDFGTKPERKKETLLALYDLAQHEFGQSIIANAPLGIAFKPKLSQQNALGTYYDYGNTIALGEILYQDSDHLSIVETLAHEMVHGTQNAHGRTNTYLCSPTEYLILQKLCETEAKSLGFIAAEICGWQLNTPENVEEFKNYDLIKFYKQNKPNFNEELYKNTNITYLFQQALKTTNNIQSAARITTGLVSKNHLQKTPTTEEIKDWQNYYENHYGLQPLTDNQLDGEISYGNAELFQHNIGYYKSQYHMTDSDIQVALNPEIEKQICKEILNLHRNGTLQWGSDELMWQQQQAKLFPLQVQAADSVEEIKTALEYFKYSKPEHSVEAQVLLMSENPIAQEALVQLTQESFLKYDVQALTPHNEQQVNILKSIDKDYHQFLFVPQTPDNLLNKNNHSAQLKNTNMLAYMHNSEIINILFSPRNEPAITAYPSKINTERTAPPEVPSGAPQKWIKGLEQLKKSSNR